jgi:hypothetical protein
VHAVNSFAPQMDDFCKRMGHRFGESRACQIGAIVDWRCLNEGGARNSQACWGGAHPGTNKATSQGRPGVPPARCTILERDVWTDVSGHALMPPIRRPSKMDQKHTRAMPSGLDQDVVLPAAAILRRPGSVSITTSRSAAGS